MGEAGLDRFHIAHVVNHRSVTHSTVRAIYDRYRYDEEQRPALKNGLCCCDKSLTRLPNNRAPTLLATCTPATSAWRQLAYATVVVRANQRLDFVRFGS
jgi:hypothetical protein